MNKKTVIVVALAIVLPLWAQDEAKVIYYEAQSAVIDEARNLTMLSGNVALKRDNLDLVADEIDVYAQENDKKESEFTLLNARGNVKAKSDSQTITSDEMTYDAKTEIAVFTGNVLIKNGSNTANGDRAEVNMATGVHKLFGPVTGTISGKLP